LISPAGPVNSVVFLTATSFFDRGDVAPAALCFFFFLALEVFFLCNRAIMHPRSQNSKLKMSGKSHGVSCHSSFELFIQNDLAGQEGFEPPTPGFGVRRSTVRATGLHNTLIIRLFGLFMLSVRPAESTIFAEFQLVWCCPFIFCSRVVSSFALTARKGNNYSHQKTPSAITLRFR
jgi:hypothetical protein